MSESVIEVHLPDSLLQGAETQAALEGLNVEGWLRRLAEQRVREAYVNEKYFSRECQPDDTERALAILNSSPDNPPMPGDELPEGWSPDELR